MNLSQMQGEVECHVDLVGCSKYGGIGMATRPCMVLYISMTLFQRSCLVDVGVPLIGE